MADNAKNIFVSHHHTDAESIEKLKDLLSKNGLTMRDSSIYESKSQNNAHNEEYIKSLIRPQINWAGEIIVLIGSNTAKSDWVDWEIEAAAKKDKRIIGVYLPGEKDAELSDAFNTYADSLIGWDSSSIIDALNGEDIWVGPARNNMIQGVNC
ncbi:MAG: TIR domain-containing protein [Clostridia bacterium]|nr:TIR domain-containing protein [Clostridia bacterium]